MRSDVVREDKFFARRAVCGNYVSGVQSSVVIYRHSEGICYLQESPVVSPPFRADVFEQIILDQYALHLLAGVIVVVAKDADRAGAVTHYVVAEGDIFDDRPWSCAILISHGEQDGEPALGINPVILKEVSLDQHSPGIL
jgi:hypothetical protein